MKATSIFLISISFLFSFVSCTENDDLGTILQPDKDKIVVATDTFRLSTERVMVDYIPTKIKIDTLLLGSFLEPRFGRTRGEILAQFNCPYGYIYPDNIQPDSLVLAVTYKGYTGIALSPLEVSVYRMNLQTFGFRNIYYTNIDPSLYSDNSVLLAQKPIVAQSSASTIRFNLGTSLLNEFVNTSSSNYIDNTAFTSFFNGLYLTTQYGSSLMLYVNQMSINLYYHYISSSTGSTIINTVTFPASKEVRQVNRYLHTYEPEHIPVKDSVEYIKAPAGIFTRIIMPLQRMKDSVDEKVGDKIRNINRALVNVQVTELDTTVFKLPKYMLLVRDSEMADFFKNNDLPNNLTSILGKYSSSSNSYVFDMGTYISNEFKRSDMPQKDELLLVPVMVTYSSSGYVSSVEHDIRLHATIIRSGKNEKYPLKIDIVYSGL